jgi:hypothetical protein
MDAPPPPTAADLSAVFDKITPANTRSTLDGPIAVAVLVLAALLGSFAATNSDLWLHLASGRLVVGGQFPSSPDPFSANEGATWINHAWFLDLLLYFAYKLAGGAALVAAKAMLVVLLAGILLLVRRPKGGALAPAAMTTLVLLAISPLLLLRSTVGSYVLFAALVLILHRWPLVRIGRAAAERFWPFPATVGGLFVVWVNTDGGFVFGLLLLAVWTIGAIFQRGLPVGEVTDDPGEAGHTPVVLAAALAAALIGCLINPYHIHAFRLPTELTALTLPPGFRGEKYFEPYYRSAFSKAHVTLVGPVAAGAFYLLFPLGLASFAVNIGGWRWRRVLAWVVFAWLGASFWRLTPYFAIVCGPAIVLNLQAYLARRRAAWVEKPNFRAEHLRKFFGVAGRVGLLLALLALLVLAWPGWLGSDAAPSRQVVWRADPDPTSERLANRLAGWYESGALKPGESRGFHLQPDFGFYCAWFCPPEKSLFDSRLTAPPAVVADYLAAQRAMTALADPPGPDHPGSPDPLLRKLGVTHAVLGGPGVLTPPPLVAGGLGWAVFTDPGRWPVWAITGQGVICGWRDPARRGPDRFASLRLDPIRMAVGDLVEKVPEPPADFPRPSPPSIWDPFRLPPAPPSPEAYEAGLWLSYRNATVHRARVAIPLGQTVSRLGLLAPTGVPDLAGQLSNWNLQWQVAWRQSAEGRAGRAAGILAVRACRRAIRANPNHPEAFGRLAQAYGDLDIDPAIGPIQLITAARQALTRLAVVPGRRTALQEELALHDQLLKLYPQTVIPVPDVRAQPRDLMLESLKAFVDTAIRLGPNAAAVSSPEGLKQFEADLRRYQKSLEELQADVHRRTDEYENRASKYPPPIRARIACQFGLAKEGLAVLQAAEPGTLDTPAIVLMANLLLLTGQAEDARELLQPIHLEEVQGELQRQLRFLNVQTAAALGDYDTAIEQAAAMLPIFPRPPDAERAAIQVLQNLYFADMGPAHPLTRALTMPLWGGLWQADGQPVVVGRRALFGDFMILDSTILGLKHYGDWLVRQGLLALEQGDPALSHQRFIEAVGPAAPRLWFDDRPLAIAWLEVWPPK